MVLIFLKLCQTGTGQVIWGGFFFWFWTWFWSRLGMLNASRRRWWCCVKDDDDDDGTSCGERWYSSSRSCSVSIQTVFVVAGTSSVLPCPRTGRRPGYAWTVVVVVVEGDPEKGDSSSGDAFAFGFRHFVPASRPGEFHGNFFKQVIGTGSLAIRADFGRTFPERPGLNPRFRSSLL